MSTCAHDLLSYYRRTTFHLFVLHWFSCIFWPLKHNPADHSEVILNRITSQQMDVKCVRSPFRLLSVLFLFVGRHRNRGAAPVGLCKSEQKPLNYSMLTRPDPCQASMLPVGTGRWTSTCFIYNTAECDGARPYKRWLLNSRKANNG